MFLILFLIVFGFGKAVGITDFLPLPPQNVIKVETTLSTGSQEDIHELIKSNQNLIKKVENLENQKITPTTTPTTVQTARPTIFITP
jgi:hypothetical protein